MSFSDFNNVNDRISFTLTDISQLEAGTHLEAWLVSEDGKTFRDAGTIAIDANGSGSLTFTDPDTKNLLQDYNQIQITKEQDGVSISKPRGEVVYSSVFPPQALGEVRKLIVAFDGVPESLALMQGLYYYSGSYVNTPINGDKVNDPEFGIVKAYENQDEATIRKDTEEVINQIVGDASDQYKDYDQDGTVDVYSSDGFGSLPNGDHSGYLQETALHAKNAADAPDSTPNIRQQGENIQVCIQNMTEWTNQILPLALRLNKTSFGPEMKPIIDDLSKLGDQLLNGVDKNGNGIVEPIDGECGASKAYEYGLNLEDFPIFTGPNRVPPTGK